MRAEGWGVRMGVSGVEVVHTFRHSGAVRESAQPCMSFWLCGSFG